MKNFGLYRVAVATPVVRVGNVRGNADAILDLTAAAAKEPCDLIAFPELSLTGYTCADLFHHRPLLEAATVELVRLAEQLKKMFAGVAIVGLPLVVAGRLYNVAAFLHGGHILGFVPKTHIPNYKEFYERRWFTPATGNEPKSIMIEGREIPFGVDLLFEATDFPHLVVGLEICEDVWTPIPPSCRQALEGATVLVNISGSNESTGKAEYREQLILNQSARCVAAYLYSACGVTESTTDLVFGGHLIIAENGTTLAEGKRFRRDAHYLVADIDIERIIGDRIRMSTFEAEAGDVGAMSFRTIPFTIGAPSRTDAPRRFIPAHPFVPANTQRLADRCDEIFQTQIAGLAKRIEIARPAAVQIGVSGGLDSTLAILVAAKTYDLLGRPRREIHGLTMPGFGTSSGTRTNAELLMQHLGVKSDLIDIRQLCIDQFIALKHSPFGLDPTECTVDEFHRSLANLPDEQRNDLVFENVQARTRTMLLMNRGFVIGTGDLSELALGWCTYNADHMSMYNPNASIPKTLVRFLVRWAADNEFSGAARDVLHAIADTEISPELLPVGADNKIQSTESTIGPYELHDFFLYHFLRFGFGPRKILHYARHAKFFRDYSEDDIRKWLTIFCRRFFMNQFKRSCLPDGPKVGSISLSPRGDWRMPSDAEASAWLDELKEG